MEESTVTFDDLSVETVTAYVATGEPMGKAGSFAIQGIGGSLVKGVTGCYLNVIGFPLNRFSREISAVLQKATAYY